jgi:large subunit ribosomal protein L10
VENKKPQFLEKEAQVESLQQRFAASSAAILTDYRGITVAEDTKLRRSLREAGVDYQVAKNTLIRRACHNLGIDALDPYLEGPTAVAFSPDPVAVAKIFSDFIRDAKKTAIKAALLDGKPINVAAVNALAKLPSREVLLAQILGAMQSPLSGFVGVATGLLRQFVSVLDQVKDLKAEQA